MNKNLWFYLEAIILLDDGMSQFEILSKGIPVKSVTLAKKHLDEILKLS